MFARYTQVSLRPDIPLLIWDGDCGFCKYWMLRWRNMTGDHVRYEPYQKIADEIKGIPTWAFKEAIHLVETDGKVYDGPHAAYRALHYTDRWKGLDQYYEKRSFFRYISDHGYDFVARHRPLMFRLTKLMWGKNPAKPKKYWLIYLLTMVAAIVAGSVFF